MKTTSDIFKVTDSPVIVKETPANQKVPLKELETHLRKSGFTPMTQEDREVYSSVFQSSEVGSCQSPQQVAEPSAQYPE
jgi:hypothetical protein